MPQRVDSAYIARRARALGLDPKAVLAVAAQEGLGGGIGDNGTSFGPFQLHYGGAYPSSAPRGQAASQSWAWSPQGIEYALRQIKSVANGLRGRSAVEAIVSRFERPADPRSEISRALAAYGLSHEAGTPATAGATAAPAASGQAMNPVAGAPDYRRQIALALISQIGRRNPDYSGIAGLLR